MQSLDFSVCAATRRDVFSNVGQSLLRKRKPGSPGSPGWRECTHQWLKRQLESNLQVAYRQKFAEYKSYQPDAAFNTPVTCLVFSMCGTPHEVAAKWLRSFPFDMEAALRRAIASTLQLRYNKCFIEDNNNRYIMRKGRRLRS